ncbi:unnamed protein product [Paramecium sonneborni]|uniref:Uncharacterized protein n=1 Tax=Paramecium sonneborni TaxID=65129 RepID=A0A8S1PZW7_9CILI|nr:unnamed protein product [Paramecium sonneborni]
MFQYTPQEEACYKQLWATFDPQGLGFAQVNGIINFFKKSRLSFYSLQSMV